MRGGGGFFGGGSRQGGGSKCGAEEDARGWRRWGSCGWGLGRSRRPRRGLEKRLRGTWPVSPLRMESFSKTTISHCYPASSARKGSKTQTCARYAPALSAAVPSWRRREWALGARGARRRVTIAPRARRGVCASFCFAFPPLAARRPALLALNAPSAGTDFERFRAARGEFALCCLGRRFIASQRKAAGGSRAEGEGREGGIGKLIGSRALAGAELYIRI